MQQYLEQIQGIIRNYTKAPVPASALKELFDIYALLFWLDCLDGKIRHSQKRTKITFNNTSAGNGV